MSYYVVDLETIKKRLVETKTNVSTWKPETIFKNEGFYMEAGSYEKRSLEKQETIKKRCSRR